MNHAKFIKLLQAHFTPGNIVSGYGNSLDKVISFEHGNHIMFGWQVKVAECNENGVIIGYERIHATTPSKKERGA